MEVQPQWIHLHHSSTPSSGDITEEGVERLQKRSTRNSTLKQSLVKKWLNTQDQNNGNINIMWKGKIFVGSHSHIQKDRQLFMAKRKKISLLNEHSYWLFNVETSALK